MLNFIGVDSVEDPVETEDRVEEHGDVVAPRGVCDLIAKEFVSRVPIAYTYTVLAEWESL